MSSLYKIAANVPTELTGGHKVQHYLDALRGAASAETLRWQVHKGEHHRPFHGVYIDEEHPDLLDRINSLFLLLPDGAALTGHTAAAVYGFGVLPETRIHVAVPRGVAVPQIGGVAAHEVVLPFVPRVVLGVRCVPPARCAVDLTRLVRRIDALPVLDAALFCGVVTAEELAAEVLLHDKLRGVRQARELIPLADPRPACRQESQLRLVLHDHKLPAPVPQFPIRDEWGDLMYQLDLGYADEMVGVEYDGESHLSRERMRADRRRHNELESRGWAMRYATDHDLYRRPHDFAATVAATLRERRRSPSIKGKSG